MKENFEWYYYRTNSNKKYVGTSLNNYDCRSFDFVTHAQRKNRSISKIDVPYDSKLWCFQDVFGTELSQKRAIKINTREGLRKESKRDYKQWPRFVFDFRSRFHVRLIDAHEFSKIISAYWTRISNRKNSFILFIHQSKRLAIYCFLFVALKL